MSEKIYAWLLRLYPPSFQKEYGEEALQLFRDRRREEKGFISVLRLWLDLLSDLAVSVPLAYRNASASVTVHSNRGWNGVPSFLLLEEETLNAGSILYGTIMSVAVYSSILFLFGHGGHVFAIRTYDFMQTPRISRAVPKPPPRVVVTWLPANTTSGSIVSVNATVLAVDAGPTPTGNVRFFDGSIVLDLVELNNGGVTIRRKLPRIETHSIRAVYYGDDNYSPSSSNGDLE